eukprot:COSAG06_NODE_16360_length_1005_cov_2.332230_2_plen_247_part_01
MKTHAATPRGEPIVSPVGRNGHSTKPHINLIGVRDSFCLSLACLGKLGVLNSNFFSNAEASRQLLLGFRTATASGAVPRGDLHKLNHVHESVVVAGRRCVAATAARDDCWLGELRGLVDAVGVGDDPVIISLCAATSRTTRTGIVTAAGCEERQRNRTNATMEVCALAGVRCQVSARCCGSATGLPHHPDESRDASERTRCVHRVQQPQVRRREVATEHESDLERAERSVCDVDGYKGAALAIAENA